MPLPVNPAVMGGDDASGPWPIFFWVTWWSPLFGYLVWAVTN